MTSAGSLIQVEDAVADAMMEYGPDGHIDGYKEIARAAIRGLLSLPVEQRMKAMGMLPASTHDFLAKPTYVEDWR